MLLRSAASAISVVVTILAVFSPSPACAVGSASTNASVAESPPPVHFSPWVWVAFAIIGSVGTCAGLWSILCCIFRPKDGGPHTEHPSGTGDLSPSRSQIFRRQGTPVMSGPYDRAGPSSFNNSPVEFSFEELAVATDNFSFETKIGAGNFGTVYKGKLTDGLKVAIKRKESLPRTNSQNKERAFQSELDSLSRLHHKHVMGLVGYCKEGEELLLVYEFMKNGTLYDHLHPKNDEKSSAFYSWKMRIKILLDAARGIEFLHSSTPRIIHRNIRSWTILLDANWVARVSGFSLSGPESEEDELRGPSTVGYMDSENYCFNIQSDIYCFAVVMLEVLTGLRAMEYDKEPSDIVEYAVPLVEAGEVGKLLDKRVGRPLQHEAEAVEQVAKTAVRCVGKTHLRPTMINIVVGLDRALGSLK